MKLLDTSKVEEFVFWLTKFGRDPVWVIHGLLWGRLHLLLLLPISCLLRLGPFTWLLLGLSLLSWLLLIYILLYHLDVIVGGNLRIFSQTRLCILLRHVPAV